MTALPFECFELLEQHGRFTLKKNPDAIFSVTGKELLDREVMRKLANLYGPIIGALDVSVTGSYFSNALRSLCYGQQLLISTFNLAMELNLENVTIELCPKSGRHVFVFVLESCMVQSAPEQKRETWRNQVLSDFYGHLIRPLLETMAAVVQVDVGMLWGQLPTAMHNYQDLMLAGAEEAEVRDRIAEDYAFLKKLEPAVFGRKKNPYDVRFRFVDNPHNPDKPMPIKSSCCLAYLTDGDRGCCYSCPRLSEKERDELKQKLI